MFERRCIYEEENVIEGCEVSGRKMRAMEEEEELERKRWIGIGRRYLLIWTSILTPTDTF